MAKQSRVPEFNFPSHLKDKIYHQWGQNYQRLNQKEQALDAFKLANCKSMKDLNLAVANVLLEMGENEKAYKIAQKTLETSPDDPKVLCTRNQCLLEVNKFEDALVENLKMINLFPKRKQLVQQAQDEVSVLNNLLEKSIGLDSGDFHLKKRKLIDEVAKHQQSKIEETLPRWKKLASSNECDVDSDDTITEVHESKLTNKRHELNGSIINGLYFGTARNDIKYLNKLRQDKRTHLPCLSHQTEIVHDELDKTLGVIDKVKNSLQARQPVYSKLHEKLSNNENSDRHLKHRMFLIQQASRRVAFKQLEKARKLYREHNFKELQRLTDMMLTEFYAVKTLRVFPRRYEFVNEVINIFGLAKIDSYRIPVDLMNLPPEERLIELLQMPSKSKIKPVILMSQKEFGVRMIADSTPEDRAHKRRLKQIGVLEKRLNYARYDIEKLYLFHEIAEKNILNQKYDTAQMFAKNMCEYAEKNKNVVWKYLNEIQLAKVSRGLMNFQKIRKHLYNALQLAKEINKTIETFTRLALITNANEFKLHQQMGDPRSKQSIQATY